MHTRTLHTSAVLGAILAAAVLSLATPANAQTHVIFGALVPAAPVYSIDATASVGSCSIPDSNARVTDPYPAQWLKLAAAHTNHTAAQLQIDLDSVGNLLQARIANSSGDSFLDQQALVAARGSKYAPEVRNCNSFKRSYFLDITFDTPMAIMPQTISGGGRRPVQ